jgi:hypothetical protein
MFKENIENAIRKIRDWLIHSSPGELYIKEHEEYDIIEKHIEEEFSGELGLKASVSYILRKHWIIKPKWVDKNAGNQTISEGDTGTEETSHRIRDSVENSRKSEPN